MKRKLNSMCFLSGVGKGNIMQDIYMQDIIMQVKKKITKNKIKDNMKVGKGMNLYIQYVSERELFCISQGRNQIL